MTCGCCRQNLHINIGEKNLLNQSRRSIKNIHPVNFTNTIFYCFLCGKVQIWFHKKIDIILTTAHFQDLKAGGVMMNNMPSAQGAYVGDQSSLGGT